MRTVKVLVKLFLSRHKDSTILQVRAGSNNYSSGGISRIVIKIVKHLHADIALLKLSKPLEYTNKIKSIPLASFARQDGDECTASGWGSTKQLLSDAAISESLLKVDVPFISSSTCRAISIYGYAIPDNIVCAGNVGEGGKHRDRKSIFGNDELIRHPSIISLSR